MARISPVKRVSCIYYSEPSQVEKSRLVRTLLHADCHLCLLLIKSETYKVISNVHLQNMHIVIVNSIQKYWFLFQYIYIDIYIYRYIDIYIDI